MSPAEAAAGTMKSVWSPTHGAMNVVVAPGTVDGTVVWITTPGGQLAVTVRVTEPFPAPASGYPAPAFAAPAQATVPAPATAPAISTAPATPAAPRRNGRRTAFLGLGIAALLAVGCIGVVRVASGDDSADTSANAADVSTTGTGDRAGGTTTAAPADAAPLSPQQYAQLLAASDGAIKATFSKLNASSNAAFAKAAPAAATSIRTEADKLRAAAPPAGAETVHAKLAQELESLGDIVEETAGTKQECPAASPWTTVLQSGWADGLRTDVKDLATENASYKFGSFLPAAPKDQNRRLTNGTYVKRASGGLGHLKIENGADDTAISLVPVKGKKPKPIMTVYVRSKGTFTAKGIKDGTYRVYTSSGKDWNAGRKGFTRDCSFSKFDDTFKFSTTATSSTIWTITLTPMVGGNASTSDVDPDAFPQ
ncbi:hypothetical protein L083_6146 [Actinoplanes sp. N902-109]|nr:hypothetical protein L083_6146 [Actinoplanes sp. N902-109]